MKYVKFVVNTTTVALVASFCGHYVGSKGGFHRGVNAAISMVETFVEQRDAQNNELSPRYRIAGMNI